MSGTGVWGSVLFPRPFRGCCVLPQPSVIGLDLESSSNEVQPHGQCQQSSSLATATTRSRRFTVLIKLSHSSHTGDGDSKIKQGRAGSTRTGKGKRKGKREGKGRGKREEGTIDPKRLEQFRGDKDAAIQKLEEVGRYREIIKCISVEQDAMLRGGSS